MKWTPKVFYPTFSVHFKNRKHSQKILNSIRAKFRQVLIPVLFFYVPPHSDNDNPH